MGTSRARRPCDTIGLAPACRWRDITLHPAWTRHHDGVEDLGCGSSVHGAGNYGVEPAIAPKALNADQWVGYQVMIAGASVLLPRIKVPH